MATSYTSLIGLALPVTGELSGTWGDTVNNYISTYIDSAVAGTQTISGSQTAVTLSVTNGSALSQAGTGATGSAQYTIINCTGNPAGTLTITAPASSKSYIIINSTSTSQSVKIVGAGPTTGVTVASGDKALVAWSGADFVRIGASAGGTNTQVQYNSSGNLAGSANMTFDGTKLTVANILDSGLTASQAVFTDASKNLVSVATTGTGSVVLGTGPTITLANGTGLPLSTGVTGQLPIANGGTGQNSANAGFNALSPMTTAGDIIYGGVAGAGTRLGIGSNGYVLTVSSGAPVWAAASAATPGGSNTQIQFNNSSAFGGSANLVWDGTYVGVGTSSPSTYADTTPGITTYNSTAGGRSGIVMGSNATATDDLMGYVACFNSNSSNVNYRMGSMRFLRGSDANSAYMSWFTANSGAPAERMRLDASGNLGVGTTAPNTKLEAYTTSAGTVGLLTLQQADNSGGNSWGIDFRRTAGAGANVVRAKIFAVREGNDANGLAFSYTTSGGTVTQGLTLDSSGKFSVGAAVGGYLSVQGSVNADFVSRIYNNDASGKGMLLYYSAAAPNNAGVTNAFAMGQDNAAIRWYFSGNGGLNNFSANNTNLSDVREKKNIALAGNYLDKINAIPVKTFLYNDQTDNELNLGVIAQDVQAVAPELVTESDWGTLDQPKMRLSVYQTDLQYALMKAIQELSEKLDAANARIAALEAK